MIPVYMTAAGKFLPGSPIGNEEVEQYWVVDGGAACLAGAEKTGGC